MKNASLYFVLMLGNLLSSPLTLLAAEKESAVYFTANVVISDAKVKSGASSKSAVAPIKTVSKIVLGTLLYQPEKQRVLAEVHSKNESGEATSKTITKSTYKRIGNTNKFEAEIFGVKGSELSLQSKGIEEASGGTEWNWLTWKGTLAYTDKGKRVGNIELELILGAAIGASMQTKYVLLDMLNNPVILNKGQGKMIGKDEYLKLLAAW